jgi:AraC-like DNA-binding protein
MALITCKVGGMRISPASVGPSSTTSAELRHYRDDHGVHTHGHAQLLFGVGGCLDVEVGGHLMRVDASTGLIVPAGVLHASAARHGADVWVVDVPAAQEFDRLRPLALALGRPQGLSVEHWLDFARSARRALPRRRLDTALLEIAVDKSLHGDWSAARMAAQFALSVPQFHARWRLLTGQTPQAWLRERRLNAAERLLRAGWPGDTVAAQVGYTSASALLFALRRERGIGARDLRRA